MMMVTMALAIPVALTAAPITYIFTGTASGTVASTPFTNSLLTIQVSTDTTAVVFLGGPTVRYQLPYAANALSFSLSAGPAGTLSNLGAINDNQSSNSLNLADSSLGKSSSRSLLPASRAMRSPPRSAL
jgi:hypothetical protein